MSEITVSLWHDVSGEIVAIGRAMGERKAVPLAGNGLSILDIKVDEDEIRSLPLIYVVDSTRRELIRRRPIENAGSD